MQIQLINNSKLKIDFNLTDLKENNLTLHSFLSGSDASKLFVKALLEIAEEDFGIILENTNFHYETFCINFSEFIILITFSNEMYVSTNTSSIKKNQFTKFNTNNSYSFKFIDNKLFNYINSIYYTFNNIENFFDFSNYSRQFLKKFNIDSTLYKYKNIFLLEIKTHHLSTLELEKIISIFSEIKNMLIFSDLFITHIKEFSEISISTNALNI